MRSTINSYLDDYMKRGSETAFAQRQGLRLVRWSYARVAESAFRFARELEARGVSKGERVMLWAANGHEWVAAFFGCALRGAVVVPLDVESAPDFVSRVREQTSAALLLTSAETRRHAEGLGLPTLALEDLEEVIARHSPAPFVATDITEDDLVEIIYTSGTTAEPRGVCLTHRNLLANLAPLEDEMRKYQRWLRLVHPLRFLCLLPLSHVFGQFMGILVPQLTGGEVIFHDSLNPSEIVATIKSRRVSVVVTVPRLLDSLREHVERRESTRGRGASLARKILQAKGAHPLKRLWMFRRLHNYFGWKLWAFVTGGATLEAETETFWRRTGFAVVQGYGMTETASLITVNHPFKPGRGSIGKLLPGQELKLDETGEILVRGANVSPGYWRAGATEPLADGGWLRTGDLGERDEAGHIYFRGRKKDVIVTAAGLNVYPADIEAAFNRQPEVRESAVVGIEGARGPEPLAVLIMRDAKADPAPVIARVNASLSRHQHVRRWHVWPESDFPRTATQKVRKRDILERLSIERAQQNGGANGNTPHAVVLARMNGDGRTNDESKAVAYATLNTQPSTLDTQPSSLIAALASRAGGETPATLDASTSLSTDLKLDSLGRVELLSALEDRYQIEIDEASFTAATTVGEVERIVSEGGVLAEETTQYPYPAWTQSTPVRWLRIAIFYAVVLPITSLLCWARVRGVENLLTLRGPALFVSNHITYFDHALILSALPGRFRRRLAIAQEGERLRWWRRPPSGTPWHRRWRWLAQYFLVVTIFDTFSLPKASGFRRSFAYAGESVDRGYSLLVFPEGVRAEAPGMNPFMGGIGVLASKLGVPVVPVRIDGLLELKLSGRRGFTSPHHVTIRFGEPITYDRDDDPAKITADLERRVKGMKDEG
ncbi:MAG: long-chain acyl-CoA synthetase [Acidobacteriota bacterium]|jgi:long-chain acyl-CoA synthetase|nr:long-chain acyl-CoA synthetase [Acidobacteriota bacterium]